MKGVILVMLAMSLGTGLSTTVRSIREFRTVAVPEGTRLTVAVTQDVSSLDCRPGNAFEARTLLPVMSGGVTVIPAGTVVRAVLAAGADTRSGRPLVVTFDKFQNARGEWQDLPVTVLDDDVAADLPAGHRLKAVTRAPMQVPIL